MQLTSYTVDILNKIPFLFSAKPDSWKERPFTDCPRAHDPMDSGIVRLKNLTTNFHPDDKITYRYDCTWQIKPPSGEHALITYLKLLQANLDDGKDI